MTNVKSMKPEELKAYLSRLTFDELRTASQKYPKILLSRIVLKETLVDLLASEILAEKKAEEEIFCISTEDQKDNAFSAEQARIKQLTPGTMVHAFRANVGNSVYKIVGIKEISVQDSVTKLYTTMNLYQLQDSYKNDYWTTSDFIWLS